MTIKTYTGPLSYYNGENEVPEGSTRISASSISRFFSNTRQYWGELKLGETGFISSTASVLGTITHRVAELYAKNQEVTDQDKQDIEDYIVAHTEVGWDLFNPEVDGDIIRQQYPIMGQALVRDYVSQNMPVMVEPFVYHEELPGIGAGGSIDNVSGVLVDGKVQQGCIVDYKTTSATKIPDTISYPYKLQLLTYAYLMGKHGHSIERIRIVYVSRNNVGRVSEKTGKPLKQYPTEVKVLTHQITREDMEYIENVIKLIADSIYAWDNNPDLRYLLAHDYRLKEV